MIRRSAAACGLAGEAPTLAAVGAPSPASGALGGAPVTGVLDAGDGAALGAAVGPGLWLDEVDAASAGGAAESCSLDPPFRPPELPFVRLAIVS